MYEKYEKIGNYKIILGELYFIAYAGGTRELSAKDQKEWDRTKNLPFQLQVAERRKLTMEKNPNVIPVTGRKLMEFIREMKFVPLFDTFFEVTHVLKLTDLIVYEAIKAKSYEMAMGKF